MAKITTYLDWDTYRKVILVCERKGITPYRFFKEAILKALKEK